MKKILLILIIILSLLISIMCGYVVFSVKYEEYQDNQEKIQLIDNFKEQIINNNEKEDIESNNNENNINNDKDDPNYHLDSSTNGILIIESLEVEAPMKTASIYDTETVDKILKSHIVVYDDYGSIGKSGTNTIMAAHSTIYDYCAYCHFTTLDKIEYGSEVSIIWEDGYQYNYVVEKIELRQDPTAEWIFEDPDDNNQYITMITCTRWESDKRTVVRARLDSTNKIF